MAGRQRGDAGRACVLKDSLSQFQSPVQYLLEIARSCLKEMAFVFTMASPSASCRIGLGGLAQIGNNNILDPSAQIRNGVTSQTSAEGEQIGDVTTAGYILHRLCRFNKPFRIPQTCLQQRFYFLKFCHDDIVSRTNLATCGREGAPSLASAAGDAGRLPLPISAGPFLPATPPL